MPRIASGLLIVAISLGASLPAEANWFKTTYYRIRSGWHENNLWPQQYLPADRQSVKEPFAIMHARGWQRANLLGEHHFEQDQPRLTMAGMLRVKAILANSPPQYRTVYVEKGANRQITDARVDAVQQAIVGMQTQGPLPAVLASDMIYEGWSSEYVDAVTRKYQTSIPQPRLPTSGASSSSSSSP
jgi:hypothetical protein